ncbi:hypothetical protein Tco_0285762 [Tanacetum coccineum]
MVAEGGVSRELSYKFFVSFVMGSGWGLVGGEMVGGYHDAQGSIREAYHKTTEYGSMDKGVAIRVSAGLDQNSVVRVE